MNYVKYADKWHTVDDNVKPAMSPPDPLRRQRRPVMQVMTQCCAKLVPAQINPATGAMWTTPIDNCPSCSGE